VFCVGLIFAVSGYIFLCLFPLTGPPDSLCGDEWFMMFGSNPAVDEASERMSDCHSPDANRSTRPGIRCPFAIGHDTATPKVPSLDGRRTRTAQDRTRKGSMCDLFFVA
jgi:hypothetical protein